MRRLINLLNLIIFLPLVESIVFVNVTTSRGIVIGSYFNQGTNLSALFYGQADTFYGIPFAQPPQRFARPQRLETFSENPYNATYARPECIQGSKLTPQMSEDCLYLNVYTPNASSITKYPVMVFIHGGGLRGGNAGLSLFGTVRNLVSRGVVVSSIQYRLGFLGFFTTFTDDFPPNLGMLDQVEALKFINEEISNFGGNPTKITIFGQSAGSASVSAHLYSPLSQNLFQQAIQESGTVLTCFEGSLGPTYANLKFAWAACKYNVSEWNSLNYGPLKECLLNISINDGLGAAERASAGNAVCWNMVQDNYFFPGIPRTLSQNLAKKPVIIGTNKDEMAFPEVLYKLYPNYTQLATYNKTYVEFRLSNDYANFLGNHSAEIAKILESTYLNRTIMDNDHVVWLEFLVDFGTSFFFTGPSSQEIVYHLMNQNPNVYAYEFTWSSKIEEGTGFNTPGYNPVPHGAEVAYVFFMLEQKFLDDGTINATDLALANFFGEAWTNFAKYGKPTMDDSWKPTTSTDANSMEYYEIGANSKMGTGYRSKDHTNFNQALPQILGVLPPDSQDFNNGSLIACPPGWARSSVRANHCFNVFTDELSNTRCSIYSIFENFLR